MTVIANLTDVKKLFNLFYFSNNVCFNFFIVNKKFTLNVNFYKKNSHNNKKI